MNARSRVSSVSSRGLTAGSTFHFNPNPKITRSPIYKAAKDVCSVLAQNNFTAYMVGGCVRDFLMFPTRLPKDIDIATDAGVEDIEKCFHKSAFVGKSFGVCVVQHEGFSFEVASFRKEGAYLDRRHPSSVTASTIVFDSRRRDFTINALYFSPLSNEIVDFHHGIRDLQKKIIRCVGKADDRIYEDALRILRCLRFSTNFSFKIEKTLLISLKKHVDGLKLLPMERILDELIKVHNPQKFVEAFFKCLDISPFFANLTKKTSKELKTSSALLKQIRSFKFSQKSLLFDFFIVFLTYYKIKNFEQLKAELKSFPCSVYDKKLCLWFLNLLSCDIASSREDAFEFFKELVKLERIEKHPNPKIFTILKTFIVNGIGLSSRTRQHVALIRKIITHYAKTMATFSPNTIIETFRRENIPEHQFSSLILRNRFNNIFN